MYFDNENKFYYKMRKIIPLELTDKQLNSWLISQNDKIISQVNNIMKDYISLETDKKAIKNIDQIMLSYETLYEDGIISDVDYYTLMEFSGSTKITPRQEMLLLSIISNINKTYATKQFDIADFINESKQKQKKEEDIFDIFESDLIEDIDETQKIDDYTIEDDKMPTVSYLESFKKTSTTFSEIYKEKFIFSMKDYQIRTINWLIERKYTGVIGAETGVGKTLIGLAISEFLYEIGAISKIIIICPLSTINVWKMEMEKHFVPDVDENKYIIINYEKLLTKTLNLPNGESCLCILDEAHRIKNEFAQTTARLIEMNFKYKIGLSATIVDKLSELNFIANTFGFEQPYNVSTEEINMDICSKFLCNISANLAGIVEHEEVLIPIELENRIVYERLSNDFKDSKINIVADNYMNMYCSYNNIFSTTTKYPNINKKNELKKILNYHKDDQVIIFTSYIETSKHLFDVLSKDYDIDFINGDVDVKKRNIIIEKFIKNKTQHIIATKEVMGMSQNLQNANVIIFYDHGWSMPQKKQAKGRILRLNQEKKCYIYNLYYKNTIEHEILFRVNEKENNFITLMKALEI